MSASNRIFNVFLIGVLGLVGLSFSVYLLLGSNRAISAVYDTGLEKLEAGDLESARLAFERALARSENKAPAAYQLALLEARSDPAKALPLIRRAIDEGQPTGPMIARMGKISLAAGEIPLTEELATLLQSVDPSNPEILPLRGGLAIAQHRFGDAISLFEELLSSGSATGDVKLTLGRLLAESDNLMDQTRAKVIIMDAASGDDIAAKNALLFIVASGKVKMEARDWRQLFAIGMQKGFLEWPSIKENLPFMRRLMVLAARYDHSITGDIANKRAIHPDAETVDFVDAAMVAQRVRNLRRAKMLLDAVPEAEQQSIGVRMLRANQLILEGRPDAGMVELEQVMIDDPDNQAALPLLRDLAAAPEGMLSVQEQILVLRLLINHPYSSLNDRFNAFESILKLRPLGVAEVMEEVRSTIGQKAPRQTASWFLDRGTPRYVLELITPEMANSDAGLFELRLIALLRMGNTEEAEAMIQVRPASLPSVMVITSRLRLAVARGEVDQARELWNQAFAMSDSQGLLSFYPILANMALEFDSAELALRGFQLAFERGSEMSEKDWLRFTELGGASKSLVGQRAIAEAAVRAYPENPVFINNEAYLQLLSGINARQNLVRMEELVDEHPGIDSFRVTLALAYLKNDRATMAVRTMERIEMNWTPAGASAQVIYLAALAEGDRRGMAENFARNVDTSNLLPEEYELIASLLKN